MNELYAACLTFLMIIAIAVAIWSLWNIIRLSMRKVRTAMDEIYDPDHACEYRDFDDDD